ncbi:matrix metalloproteinase-11 [Pseudarthrobacter sp. NamE2]|uniref:matrix metalloproteinase-11 n=1 Tax=Pseudarthrobacter sp. NamE2 TaxID=2576838 RepID=UPI0010FEB9C3|nr:matrix metalloproteinase-11 [Pseudarthrobacter sp. NamE2]TLM82622.1 matrix metalloproteinase-11 [Pseudarthrobacter sp. NamE2]
MESAAEDLLHRIADGFVCATEGRGHATPGGRPPSEIVVDATEGFVPLWHAGTILKWRFQERSFALAPNPEQSKQEVGDLMGESLLRWGSAAPVRFTRDDDLWDFEIVLRNAPDCTPAGCVLASAFFPDGGRHQLTIYPTMFQQVREEQIETMIHEFGHVFGLRHFFANVRETAWPSEIFGTHEPFTIMNYGSMSRLTDADLGDLKELYRLAWSGHLTNINGTPIRLVHPYSFTGSFVLDGAGAVPSALQPAAR